MRPDVTVWRAMADALAAKGALYLILVDPDRHDEPGIRRSARAAREAGADAILVGTSLTLSSEFRARVAAVREEAGLPVILFPAHAGQVIPEVDAVFFLSLLSGRNPQYLIGEQVRGAPLVKAYGLEAIPVGYLLVESGRTTSVEFMSDTRAIPREKPEIAVAHALAAECLGMRLVYLEAGSGAANPVPEEMIRAVAAAIALPLVVGGGVRTPEAAGRAVRAGASLVVIGNVLEETDGAALAREFARAVHAAGSERLEDRARRADSEKGGPAPARGAIP